MRTPVLFLIFNRPDPTEKVFEAIRRARPPRLYVAGDGARANRPDEMARCELARKIATAVDWPCEVVTLFRATNLGCKRAVSQGITWFFEQEEEGIILEDDVVPDPTFFMFCEELLERYRTDAQVMMISADHFHGDSYRPDTSYFFSRYTHVWGWASWRRAWGHYDVDMSRWPATKASDFLLRVGGGDRDFVTYWTRIFDATHDGVIDTWDYQWLFATMLRDGLAITPSRNLARNVGFYADATHTTDAAASVANLPLEPMSFPMLHPAAVVRDSVADRWEEEHLFSIPIRRFNRIQQWVGALRLRIGVLGQSFFP